MTAHTTNDDLRQVVADVCDDRRNRAWPAILVTYAVLVGAFWALHAWPGWPTYVAVFVTVGLMQYRLAMSCHEGVHKTLLFPLWLNEWVSVFHGSLVGINMARYRSQHLAHHKAHDDSDDPDAYIYRPILATAPGWRRAAVWVFGTPIEVVQKFLIKGASVSGRPGAGAEPGAGLQTLVMIAVNAGLFGLFALVFQWWCYFVFWLLPVMTVAVFMNRTRILIEHGFTHVAAGSERQPPIPLETVDVLTNPVEVFFLAPFWFNFHYAHHRFPSVPHYRNRDVSDRLADEDDGAFRRRASYLALLGRVLWGKR